MYTAGMAPQEFVAYLGSILMFSTFWMKMMIPLRIVGIGANVTMLAYGILAGLYPVVVLQGLMLPVNVYRLAQMRRLIGRVALASKGDFRPDALVPFMNRQRRSAGEVVFRAGDEPDAMYLIQEGSIELTEIGRTLGRGDIFGEIAIVSADARRTATAVCAEDSELLFITPERVRRLFYQNPDFGFFLIRLVTGRLLEGFDSSRAKG